MGIFAPDNLKISNRQGGTSGSASWATSGTTNSSLAGVNVLVQVGTIAVTANPTVVTFPVAFSQVPHVQLTEASASSSNAFCLITAVSATSVSIRVINDAGAVVTTETVNWLAIGQ